MTIQAIRDSIGFKIKDQGDSIEVFGGIIIKGSVKISKLCYRDRDVLIRMAKESVRTEVLHRIYEDRMSEMAEAIREFEMAAPFDFRAQSAAKARLINTARFL